MKTVKDELVRRDALTTEVEEVMLKVGIAINKSRIDELKGEIGSLNICVPFFISP